MFLLEAEGSLNITCLVTNVARGSGGGQDVVWRHRGGQRISYRYRVQIRRQLMALKICIYGSWRILGIPETLLKCLCIVCEQI